LSGISSASQITKTMELQLDAGVAYSLEIAPERVQLQTEKTSIRRLLAVPVTFRVLTTDESDAFGLQQKAATADLQVI
jgi:hypothetical protein